jgi:hypothetical protein
MGFIRAKLCVALEVDCSMVVGKQCHATTALSDEWRNDNKLGEFLMSQLRLIGKTKKKQYNYWLIIGYEVV